jgi:aminomethyltransferase
MVPFAGWDMPVQYPQGIISEVRSVRNSAGMFDVSHMGRVEFSGPGAQSFLGTVLSVDMAALGQGRSKYHVICNEQGGIIDDAIVYRLGPYTFLLVINAGNADADLAWLLPRAERHGASSAAGGSGQALRIDVLSERVAMIAVQGPKAVETVDRLSAGAASAIRRFSIGEADVAGTPCRLGRTGYTGEDGFEIMPPAERAAELWSKLAAEGVAMCGLGARDVLRLEAGLMLHGNDMTVENNPIEAGLERFLFLDGPGYLAAAALKRIKAQGTPRVLVGFKMTGAGIARHGMSIVKASPLPPGEGQGEGASGARAAHAATASPLKPVPTQSGGEGQGVGETPAGERIGIVTSGTHSPTLDAAIGMGYVDRRFAAMGARFDIDIRGKLVEAEAVPMPFYTRKK